MVVKLDQIVTQAEEVVRSKLTTVFFATFKLKKFPL